MTDNYRPRATARRSLRLLAVPALLAISSAATAHDVYIWPSFFSLNSEKPTHVVVDVTASHTPFRPDFAMSSHGLGVLDVDGKKMRRSGAFFQSHRRSSFDLPVEQSGTYALTYERPPRVFTSYVIGRSEERKWIRANKAEAAEKLPAKAQDVKSVQYSSFAVSYVTNNAPTEAALAPRGEGFEIVPITHPADYVTGEPLQVAVLSNGEPLADHPVLIELEGARYRSQPVALELNSDAEGKVTFTLEEGGRYLLKSKHEWPSERADLDAEAHSVFYSFEVIFE